MKTGKLDLTGIHQTGFHDDVTDEERLSVLTDKNLIKQLSIVPWLLDNGFLKEDIHFRDYEGNKALMKAGAETIATIFNLIDSSEQIECTKQPFKAGYFIEDEKRITTKGYYSFTVKSKLIHKRTGDPWGSCIGLCHSLETRYRISAAGTILKVAGNRAFIGAVIKATSCSDLFVVDEDKETQPEKTIEEYPRKRLTEKEMAKPSFCPVCQQSHKFISPFIIKVGKPYYKWVPEDCFNKK